MVTTRSQAVSAPSRDHGGAAAVAVGRRRGAAAPPPHRRTAAAAPLLLPPLSVDLRCLDGVRALSCIGVISLHCFMNHQFWLSYQAKFQLQANPAYKLASACMGWVDVLFVMSAMLAAAQLLPPLEDRRQAAPPARQVVLGYWRRRAARLLPAYLATNLLLAVALAPGDGAKEVQAMHWIQFGDCSPWGGGLARNLLLLNNLGGPVCGVHLWTVALQAHFYLAFPLLLWALRPRSPGFRARLAAALGAAVAGGTAWRLHAIWRAGPLEFPISDFAVDPAAQQSWASMVNATYKPTAARVAELAVGAALGLLLRSPAALQALRRRKGVVSAAALALLAAQAGLLVRRPLLFRTPGSAPWPLASARLQLALASYGSPLYAACVAACLLALMLHADPAWAAAARVLGAQQWRPLARLSYALYLVAEHARLWALLALVRLAGPGWVPRAIAAQPLASFAAVTAGSVLAAYPCALLLHWLVERPFLGAY